MIKKTFRTVLVGGALSSVLLATAPQAMASCGTEDYIGSICMTAASFCPRGTMEAAGQTLAIQQNTALYSLLGTQYGGDGTTNFKLPDLRGRTPVGLGTGAGLSPVTLGLQRGWERQTMTVAQMPAHNHTAAFTPSGSGGGAIEVTIPVSSNTSGNLNVPDAAHSYLAGSPGGPNGAQNWSDTMNQVATVKGVTASGGGSGGGTVTVGNNGGSQPIDTVPPQLGMRNTARSAV